MSDLFLDGKGHTAGTDGCRCDMACEFPCWQRVGWAPACSACECDPFEGQPAEPDWREHDNLVEAERAEDEARLRDYNAEAQGGHGR